LISLFVIVSLPDTESDVVDFLLFFCECRRELPDDLDIDDGNRNASAMEYLYTELAPATNLPNDNPPPTDFLYRRYGFLPIQPLPPPNLILSLSRETAYRIVGLEVRDIVDFPEHLNSFITDVLNERIPAGNCDLSKTSPPNQMLPSICKMRIHESIFLSTMEELSEAAVFTFVDTTNTFLLVIYDPLSILEIARAGILPQLGIQLEYLLLNGSQFTLLYPKTLPSTAPHRSILTFPTRDTEWTPNAEDFRAYMSGLKTFFLERPYMLAAAFSRGGIAWRIAREVVGMENYLGKLLLTYPNEGSLSVNTRQGEYWFHKPDEREWFYLVGGYKVLTGL
jgi:hypothetical protein